MARDETKVGDSTSPSSSEDALEIADAQASENVTASKSVDHDDIVVDMLEDSSEAKEQSGDVDEADAVADADQDAANSQLTSAFQKLHPVGWVAAGIAVLAGFATVLNLDLLIGRMPLWLWALTLLVILAAAIPNFLHIVRRGIESIASIGGGIAMVLAWAIFLLSLFNVITRYTNNLFERDILFGETVSLAWMSFAALFLFGVAAGVKNGINPRIDFWWAEFKPRTKAWLDFAMHTLFLMPFLILGLRVLKPYAAQALGYNPRLNDGEGGWKAGWRVWESWEQSPDAGQLPVGPIKAMVIVGFALWAAQIFAEMIKTGYVLAGRHDLGEIKETEAPARVE